VREPLTQTKDVPDTQASDRPTARPPGPKRLSNWLMANQVHPVVGPEAEETHAAPQAWWKVVCLTGVDYLSTLS
jgi:hypothetical protein